MSFSPPTLSPIGCRQGMINQRSYPRAIIRTLTLLLTSHLNARCKGMFGSFTIKQIKTNGARHDYLAFLARLSPAISEPCLKIKHHWSKSEAKRRNNEVGI